MRPIRSLAAAVVLLLTPPALCEDWSLDSSWFSDSSMEFDLTDGYAPAIGPDLVASYADALGMGPSQRDAALDLARSMEDQHLELWVEHAERARDAGDGYFDDEDRWEKMQEEQASVVGVYAERRSAIVDMFHEDLRLLVTPEQEARWDMLEIERLRRDTLVRFGGVEGEQIDLASVVRGLDLDDETHTSLRPVLARYAQAMHDALLPRNRALRTLDSTLERHQEVEQGWGEIDWDAPDVDAQRAAIEARVEASAEDVIRDAISARSLCERVAGVNKAFREELESVLGTADREALARTIDGSDEETDWFNLVNSSDTRERLLEFIEHGDTDWSGLEYEWQRDSARALGARPLTARQIAQCEEILERLVADLEALGEDPPEVYERWMGASDDSFGLRSLKGYVRLSHTDSERARWSWGDMDEADQEAVNRFQRDYYEIERRYLKELRSLLTVRQRALLLERG